MRIITGKYKGRHFDIPRSFKARPTTDFAKENIFNVLTGYMGFEGATTLDLFSGTGSITLELLSRGCAHVISIEADRDHHRFIMQCLQKLKDTSVDSGQWTVDRYDHNCHCLPIRGDVFRFVKSCKQQFDLIFADPPYALKELPTIPSLIFEKNLLKPEGVFVFEHGKDHDFRDHPNFVEHRSYGSVNFSIFRPLHQR
jgi:16S rRNA (guanine(966)-N(2))-methyltransferase RsmD